ncbi:MAG: DMT family transporter [Calditrichaceae bacterium]|nr:DMT family transporter [Calditrichaceae bacterium]MBN2710792.1 DMT family transporter [Calditrichaceae bacterium]
MRKADKYFTLIFLLIPSTWAGSFIAAKYVVLEMSAVDSVVYRFLISAVFMFPGLILFYRSRHPVFRDKGFLWHLLIVVVIGGIAYHLLFFKGMETTSPTNAALIIALNPFFTAFGEIIFLKTKRPGRFYLGFILAFSGAVWVNIARGGEIDFKHLGYGEFYCFLAALCWSAFTLSARITKKPHWDAMWINAYNYLFTGVFLLPFMTDFNTIFDPLSVSGSAWLGLLYMGFFPTAIGYTLFYIGIQKKGPAWASTFIYLVPSFTAVFDRLVFSNPFTTAMITGTTFVIGGLFLGNIGQKHLDWLKEKMGMKS